MRSGLDQKTVIFLSYACASMCTCASTCVSLGVRACICCFSQAVQCKGKLSEQHLIVKTFHGRVCSLLLW